MARTDILLIYPQLGTFDELLRDIPLSLIYAATDAVKKDFRVKILDLRLFPDRWKEQVDAHLKDGCQLVGLSVMTGNPIKTALAISHHIKKHYAAKIVWGGPHPTILPEQTLQHADIDYVVRDWGSKALCRLAESIYGRNGNIDDILGLCYKQDRQIILNRPQCRFEQLDFKDLPYRLVDISSNNYNRLENGELIFPIFTATGCPYQCSFCMSPAVYQKIKGKKWIPHGTDDILEHISYLQKMYTFQRLQIYDDDSFVDLNRMVEFFSKYIRKGFHRQFKLDFRGARINELDRMDHDFMALMVKANTELLAIGAESGSDEMLERMNKGITVEQIVNVNRKLAKYPTLKPHYNFFCGSPGETLESLAQTKKLVFRLLQDNKHCYLGSFADWKPLPGSAMTDRAVRKYGLRLPDSLEEWAEIDSFDAKKIIHPWYTRKMNNTIKLFQIAGPLLDRKIKDMRKDMHFFIGNGIYFLSLLYRPFLLLRLKLNIPHFLFEYHLKNFFFHQLSRLVSKRSKRPS
jgi:radical SAM superfamily enzyme YgiQ (UPF0313 family)